MVNNALKIVLKGDQGVGKTTIAAQFAEKVFDLRYAEVIRSVFLRKNGIRPIC